jgi:hypothetical protein
VTARKLLGRAIEDVQEGRELPHVIRDPAKNRFPHLLVISDMISSDSDWKAYTRSLEAEARAKI